MCSFNIDSRTRRQNKEDRFFDLHLLSVLEVTQCVDVTRRLTFGQKRGELLPTTSDIQIESKIVPKGRVHDRPD